MNRRDMFSAAGVFALLVAIAGNAEAQDQHNYTPPGARAAAMGGAFIGVADDATTALTNPGGLSNLTRPEVYVEYKNLSTELSENRAHSLSFLSGAFPASRNITVAIISSQYENVDHDGLENPIRVGDLDYHYTGNTYAGSVGMRIADRLRLGVTAGMDSQTFELEGEASTTRRFRLAFGGLWNPNNLVTIGASGTYVDGSYIDVGDTSKAGIGVSLNPTPHLLFAVDVEQLFTSYTFTFNGQEFSAGDHTRVHVGTEYLMMDGVDHKVFLRGGFCECESPSDDSVQSAHSGTVGFGYAWKQAFQTDFAFASKSREVTLSAAFRF